MAEQAQLEIRPTMRFVSLTYGLVLLLLAAAVVWWVIQQDNLSLAGVAVAALLLLWPASKHLERQRTRCRLEGDHLRYEYGILSTTTKTIPMAKIQDVTVRRTVGQRVWGVGDLRIETAGAASALEIHDVENPEGVAQQVLAAAQKTQ